MLAVPISAISEMKKNLTIALTISQLAIFRAIFLLIPPQGGIPLLPPIPPYYATPQAPPPYGPELSGQFFFARLPRLE